MQAGAGGRGVSRRRFVASVTAVGVSAVGVTVLDGCGLIPGQAPPKVALIGYLNNNSATDPQQAAMIDGFRQGLREQGLVEGQNLLIEWRFGEGQSERLPALTAELIGLGVRLIVTNGPTATEAARQLTDRVPIVMLSVGDPLAPGWVASLARPGGNVTGPAGFGLIAKSVELLAAVAPTAHRLAYMTNPVTRDLDAGTVRVAAEQMGMLVLVLDLRAEAEIEPAFAQARVWGAEALYVINSAPFNRQRALVPTLAARSRLPAISPARAYVDAGLLMSFSDAVRQRGLRAGPLRRTHPERGGPG
jgi:putative ABC transport system substrate-binding protein